MAPDARRRMPNWRLPDWADGHAAVRRHRGQSHGPAPTRAPVSPDLRPARPEMALLRAMAKDAAKNWLRVMREKWLLRKLLLRGIGAVMLLRKLLLRGSAVKATRYWKRRRPARHLGVRPPPWHRRTEPPISAAFPL